MASNFYRLEFGTDPILTEIIHLGKLIFQLIIAHQ